MKSIFTIYFFFLSFGTYAQVVVEDSLESRPAIPIDKQLDTRAKVFSWGLRGAFSKTKINTSSGDVVQVSPSGTPLLLDGKVVRDKIISNSAYGNGFQGGFFVRFSKDPLYLQTELIFASKGGRFDFLDQNGDLINRVDAEFTTIDLPILLGIKFKKARIFGGPVISYALDKNNEFSESLAPYSAKGLTESFFNRPIVNAMLGIGFEFNSFLFDLRYEGGIGQYGETQLGPENNPKTFNFTTDQFIFSIGFIK